jgi:hypothetical protein
MNKNALFMLLPAVLLAAGCKTTEPSEVRAVSWKEQQAYASMVKDPRWFGYSIYQTPAGLEYRGGCRLHPNRSDVLLMSAKKPFRPVVMMDSTRGKESPVLIDFSAAASWMEFDLARSVRAVPVSEQKAELMQVSGDEVPVCLSVVPTLRLDQVFIENPQVFVRMANGSLGSLSRGMVDPEPRGVVGWDILKLFAQIHLDYTSGQIALVTMDAAYTPDPSRLVSRIPLVRNAGVCAIRGVVDGQPEMILIDPAGDFEVATDGGQPVQTVELDAGIQFVSPEVAVSPGGLRIGARGLQHFKVTVCPQEGMIYFEKPAGAQDWAASGLLPSS